MESIQKDEGLALINKTPGDLKQDIKIEKKKKNSFKIDVKKINDNAYKFIKKKKV